MIILGLDTEGRMCVERYVTLLVILVQIWTSHLDLLRFGYSAPIPDASESGVLHQSVAIFGPVMLITLHLRSISRELRGRA